MSIEDDHKHFIDVISGKLRKELQKYIKTNKFVKLRGKNGRTTVNVPYVDIQHFVYGENDTGVGRGQGKKGDVFRKDPKPGQPGEAGEESGEGMPVSISLDYFLDEMQAELKLPDLKPKPTQTFEDFKIKYNDISLVGPESLRHNRKTILQALKRQAASNELETLYYVPGSEDPVRLILPINSDKRYRQYKIVKTPSTNAVVMFGRDGSGSMDEEKCDIINDIAWWIDLWVRRYYEKVEKCYFWHDTEAQEVDEEKFYNYRYGGGTKCSSCLDLMSHQFENRFPPRAWNIYCFYFTDGDNQSYDNPVFMEKLQKDFPPDVCNLFGVTQVLCDNYRSSIKQDVDSNIEKFSNVRTVSVGEETDTYSSGKMDENKRNEAVKHAIKALLSNPNVEVNYV